jgi:hypothetical protein
LIKNPFAWKNLCTVGSIDEIPGRPLFQIFNLL